MVLSLVVLFIMVLSLVVLFVMVLRFTGAVVMVLQGDLVASSTIIRSGAVAQCLVWHPDRKIVAMGWNSGEITTANLSDLKSHEVYEQISIHRAPVTVLKWNQSGSRLISGDQVWPSKIFLLVSIRIIIICGTL